MLESRAAENEEHRSGMSSLLVSSTFGNALLILVVLLVYSSSLHGGFFFDDHAFIVKERPDNLFADAIMWRRIIVHLSVYLNFRLFGDSNVAFHAGNVLIHVVNALLLRALLYRVLTIQSVAEAAGMSLIVALLWAVHPINSQAVNYTIQRCETLMVMFFLGMSLAHIKGVFSGNLRWFALSTLCYWAGALSKEPIWLAPILMVSLEWLVLSQSWHSIRSRWPVYAVYLLPAVAAPLYFDPLSLFQDQTIGSSTGASWWAYLVTQSEVIAHYLRLMFLPGGLCFDYGWPVAKSISDVMPQGLVTVSLFVLTIVLTCLRKPIAFAGLLFFVILAPSSSFIAIKDVAVEHRMYLPSASVLLAIVLAAAKWKRTIGHRSPEHRVRLLSGILGVCVCLLSGMTFVRNFDYRNRLTLWPTVIETAPQNPRGYSEYAYGLLQKGRVKEALGIAEVGASRPAADAWEAMVLGVCQFEAGQRTEGVNTLIAAEAVAPRIPELQFNLGIVLSRLGDWARARQHFARAVAIKPYHPGFLLNLAVACIQLRELDAADAYLDEILSRDPAFEFALQNSLRVALLRNDQQEAGQRLDRLKRLYPGNPDVQALQKSLNELPRQ